MRLKLALLILFVSYVCSESPNVKDDTPTKPSLTNTEKEVKDGTPGEPPVTNTVEEIKHDTPTEPPVTSATQEIRDDTPTKPLVTSTTEEIKKDTPTELPVSSSPKEPEKPKSPNIVFVLVDDVGWADVNYVTGNGKIPTLNLDKMSSDGVRLSSHYVHPTCTPSRAALMTGRYTFCRALVSEILHLKLPILLHPV